MSSSTESPALNESTTEPKRVKVQSRNEPFVSHTATCIWKAEPSSDTRFIDYQGAPQRTVPN